MPVMGHCPERKLVVKHTFLEFVETPSGRRRSFTDGIMFEDGEPDVCRLNREHHGHGEQQISQHRFSEIVPAACSTVPEAEWIQENPCSPPHSQLHVSNYAARIGSGGHAAIAKELPAVGFKSTIGERPDAKASVVPTVTMMPLATMGSTGFPTLLAPMAPNQSHAAGAAVGMQGNLIIPKQACRQDYNPVHGGRAIKSVCLSSNDVSPGPDPSENFTTVMLRNLPNKYTREMLVDLLDAEGFRGLYTFVYVPIDFKTHVGLGYAFVDLVSPSDARNVHQKFEGFAQWSLPTDKVCSVSWSHPQQQGCAEHVERYRNSPVMHETVPESWKPVLFQAGRRISFPRPTKKIRAPRIRDFS